MSPYYPSLLFLALTAVICFLVGSSKIYWRTLNHKENHWIHSNNTHRNGGVIIFSVFLIGSYFALGAHWEIAAFISLSSLPIFLCGVLEDYLFKIKPAYRIGAAFISSLIAAFLFGKVLDSVGIDAIDALLAFPIVAVCFTAVVCCALCHSFNLIDGLNGLSSGIGVCILCLLLMITQGGTNPQLSSTIVVLASCLIGFWIVNVTTTKIFLGDSGAYFIGHAIAWLCVILNQNDKDITPFAFFLASIHPISETLTSILRRIYSGQSFARPDQDHLHHVTYRFMRKHLKSKNVNANTLSGIALLTISIAASILAFFLRENTIACIVVSALFMVGLALVNFRGRTLD